MENEKKNKIVKVQGTRPVDMIQQALAGGADLEELEKLLTLQERWEANEARKAYHKAMAAFKSNAPKITKDRKVGYSTAKGKVGYSHASLANIMETVTKELSKHGLSAAWSTQQNGNIIVTCKITHELGHTEETTLHAAADESGSKNSIQAIGSTISYLERYTLLSALGLATSDMDNDGIGGEEEKVDENKLTILKDALKVSGKDEAKLMTYLGVDKLENLRKSDYAKAKIAIESKGGK